jgi:hypothetical protein
LRNLINSAINLSYEKADGVIIKSIHIDNDTGEKIVMSNSNYPTAIESLSGKADWDNVISYSYGNTAQSFTVDGQLITYNEHLLPLVLRMRIERHENNNYSLTNEITRYTGDTLANPDNSTGTYNSFTLEYTNPNNNPLFHESVMKLFTFDPNFGGDPTTTTETYLGGLSFRYYTPPLELNSLSITSGGVVRSTDDNIVFEQDTQLIVDRIKFTKKSDPLLPGYLTINGNNSEFTNYVSISASEDTTKPNEMSLAVDNRAMIKLSLAYGVEISENLTIHNITAEASRLSLTNSEGGFDIKTDGGSFYIFDNTTQSTKYLLNSNGNHDFYDGNITTTGNISATSFVKGGTNFGVGADGFLRGGYAYINGIHSVGPNNANAPGTNSGTIQTDGSLLAEVEVSAPTIKASRITDISSTGIVKLGDNGGVTRFDLEIGSFLKLHGDAPIQFSHSGSYSTGRNADKNGVLFQDGAGMGCEFNWGYFNSELRLQGNILSSSDERVKSNIQTLDPNQAKDMFDQIEAKTYDRTFHGDEADFVKKRIGFIAQDVTRMFESCTNPLIADAKESFVSPERYKKLRSTEENQEVACDIPDFQSLDYSRMITILWGTVKHLEARIQTLETQLSNTASV